MVNKNKKPKLSKKPFGFGKKRDQGLKGLPTQYGSA